MHTLEQLRSGALNGTTRLSLRAGLKSFPPEIYSLADSLEILDLSDNQLCTLPDDLPRLHKLRVIFCSNNPFTTLPPVLGRCQALSMIGFKSCLIEHVPAAALPARLRWLILTDNRIETLPDALGQCTQLEKLMLAGNRLRSLPASLAQCRQLALLRIAANQLEALPDWLASLPKLAWLAYAGNPLCLPQEQDAKQTDELNDIPWHQLTVGSLLGEGASGHIYQAWLSGTQALSEESSVALKLFKGGITSDGLPHCEMAAALQAGRHTGLIPLLGRLRGHPQRRDGLVMAQIDKGFGNLAHPPSLESCTRDVYPADRRFSLVVLLRIASTVAAVARHLHQRGILHGDLYGHNVLYRHDGCTLLSDFGAASFYASGHVTARALQQIEVRAFGYLLQELLAHCPASKTEQAALDALAALQDACLASVPAQRPLFADIVSALEAISARLP